MDQPTTNRDSTPSASRSSQSTSTWSVPSSSDAILSSVVAPKATHLRATTASTGAAFVPNDGMPVESRWSEGTFGSAAAAAASSTYSGKSAEATTTQAATATVVDVPATRKPTNDAGGDGGASSSQTSAFDSADFVDAVSKVDPVTLNMVLTSGAEGKKKREGRK